MRAIKEAYRGGIKKVLFHLPTGGGKSEVFCHIAREMARREKFCFVVTRGRDLVHNAYHRLKKRGIDAGILMAGTEFERGKFVYAISIDTLIRRQIEHRPDLVVLDECFPAGTMIDGRAIEDIRIGEYVSSYNERIKRIEKRRVVRIFKKETNRLVRVKIGSKEIICTEDHPFYISTGEYIPAKDLEGKKVGHVRLRDMQARTQMEEQLSEEKCFKKRHKTHLLKLLSISNLQRPHAFEKSYGKEIGKGKDVGDFKEDGTQTSRSGRKRARIDSASITSYVQNKVINTGIRFYNWARKNARISDALQNRFSSSKSNGRNRNQWVKPQFDRSAKERREEASVFDFQRVDRVDVYESRDSGQHNGSNRGYIVYNLEVEDNHNYFVDGFLVHNCHFAGAKSFQSLARTYPDAYYLSVTATPWQRESIRHVAEKVVAPVTYLDLVKDGFLVKSRVFAPITLDLSGVRRQGGDFKESDLFQIVDTPAVYGNIAKSFVEIARKRPALCFTVNVLHAIHLKRYLESQGIRAVHLEASSSDIERQMWVNKLRRGEIDVITNCNILATGVDIPELETVIMARPTESRILYVQQAGRGARPAPGKKAFTLLDHAGNVFRHGFVEDHRDATIDGAPKSQKAEGVPQIKTCRACFAVVSAATRICPYCGSAWPIREVSEKTEAEMREITEEDYQKIRRYVNNEPQMRFLRELLEIAMERNYKRQAIFMRLSQLYGFKDAKKLSAREVIMPITSKINEDRARQGLEKLHWPR